MTQGSKHTKTWRQKYRDKYGLDAYRQYRREELRRTRWNRKASYIAKHGEDAWKRYCREKNKKSRERDIALHGREAVAKKKRKQYLLHRDQTLVKEAARRLALRRKVFSAYGSECECCGERTEQFLTIDHINRDGNLDKGKNFRGGLNLYKHLQKLEFPKDRFRLMCFNCNLGRERNDGICPHEMDRIAWG